MNSPSPVIGESEVPKPVLAYKPKKTRKKKTPRRHTDVEDLFAVEWKDRITTEFLAGRTIRDQMKWAILTSDVLLFCGFRTREILEGKATARKIVQGGNSEAIERFGQEFREAYWSEVNGMFVPWKNRGQFHSATTHDPGYSPEFLALTSSARFMTSERYLGSETGESLLGRYFEYTLARILNARIFYGSSETRPDLFLRHPETGETILIECKSNRFSNNEKYTTPKKCRASVSRNGFYLKWWQVRSGIESELGSSDGLLADDHADASYVAFVDYDFPGLENRTVKSIRGNELRDIFGKVKGRTALQIQSLPLCLQNAVEMKSVLLFPNLAALVMWNQYVRKSRLTRGKTKDKFNPKLQDVASYYEKRQVREIRELMEDLGIPHFVHTVTGLQGEPILIESYGHCFLPEREMDFPAVPDKPESREFSMIRANTKKQRAVTSLEFPF